MNLMLIIVMLGCIVTALTVMRATARETCRSHHPSTRRPQV
jgi:hypothetical protein